MEVCCQSIRPAMRNLESGENRNDDIAWPEVGMADAKMAEGWVPGDHWGCNTEIVVQELDMI